MICDDCAKAADEEVKPHPTDCGCTCQHHPVGSVKFEGQEDE